MEIVKNEFSRFQNWRLFITKGMPDQDHSLTKTTVK
jgi:hypothetical protein